MTMKTPLYSIRCLSYCFRFLSAPTTFHQSFVSDSTRQRNYHNNFEQKWKRQMKKESKAKKKKRMDCWMSGANLHWALVIYTIIVTQVRKYKTKHRRSKEGNHSILACNNLALRLQTQPFATQQRPRQVIFHQRTTATLRDKENENVITSYPLALTAETRKRKKN